MENTNILYQHGTLELLVDGLLDGTMTMKELLSHGNTGIGTGEGLDGELIILDGVAYQVDSHGNVNVVNDDFTMPFATVHQADFKDFINVSNLSMSDFEKEIVSQANANNTFFAVLTTGTFKSIKTRAVAKSKKPYPTLVETAEKQSVFERENTTGTLLTYYSPELFNGVGVGGCHSHFLADDHQFGGHVLDFELEQGNSQLQILDTLIQHLPTDSTDYMQYNFDNSQTAEAIEKAEK